MITLGNVYQNLRFNNAINMADFIIKQSTKRLTTGYRINSAADDPGGFVIAAGLTSQIRGTEVANQNTLAAKNYTTLANSAVTSMLDSVFTMKDLSAQALATSSTTERENLLALANRYLEQMYNTQSSAKYGEQKIFEDVEASEATIAKMTEEEAIAQGYTVVKTAEELNSILHAADALNNADKKVVLMNDIDLSSIDNWVALGTTLSNAFWGTFDGNGYTISNLKIDSTQNQQGLFGYTDGAVIKNVNLKNVDVVSTKGSVGALVGTARNTNISNSSVSGSVEGTSQTGGLVGYASSGTIISNSYSIADVEGGNGAAGLLGGASSSTVVNCYSTGSVKGTDYTGGLVGNAHNSTISNSYATGNIYSATGTTGSSSFGGFIGCVQGGGAVSNSYSTGQNLATRGYRGGFIGDGNLDYGSTTSTTNAFATQTQGFGAVGTGSVTGSIDEHGSSWFNSKDNQKSILGIGEAWDYSGSTPKLSWQIIQDVAKPITFQTGYDSSALSRVDMDMALNVGGLTLDFSSDSAIRESMDRLDTISKKLEQKSAYFGAYQNTFDSVISYQELSYTNLTEARGRIIDTNTADELMRFTKATIVQQTASSLMQQCNNLNASIVMRLIGS